MLRKLFSVVDMTEGAPWKKLALFTVPLLIGNIFQQAYSTADAIMLGHFIGDNALAAVGAIIPIFFLIMVLLMGISMGTGIMISQYHGAGEKELLSRAIGAGISIITIVSLIIMLIGPFVTRPLLVLMSTPDNILDDAVVYANILVIGVLGMAYFNILSGILRGLGDSIWPLIALIVTSILNIGFNFYFIGILEMGVFGAALGTVIAQAISSIICFVRLLNMKNAFDFKTEYLLPKKEQITQSLKLGVPTGASQAIYALAMMVTQPLVNGFEEAFIATWVIVMRIDAFVMMPNFSFGTAMTVYTGQNIGAKRLDRVYKGLKQCCFMAFSIALVIMIGLLAFNAEIAGIFSDTPEIIENAGRYLWILAPGYILFSINMAVWGLIRGAGDAISPLWGAFINTIIVRLPTAYLLVYFMESPDGLFYSLLIAWITNMILGLLVYANGKWKRAAII